MIFFPVAGMEKRLRDLEERLSELSTVSSRSCSGCTALTLRVEELERRLGPEPEAQPELSITIPGNPTGAAAGDTFEEQDPVDLLLREAQQLVADGDLEDLFKLETLDTETSSTPTPSGDADQLAGDVDQLAGDADQPTRDADQPMGDANQPALAPVSRCHLILGDSIAKYLNPSVTSQDSVLNLAEGGNTWEREARNLREHSREWKVEAEKRGATLGTTFIWMGGNEVYGRPGTHPRGLDKRAVIKVLQDLTEEGSVTMAGPTIRLWRDDGVFWEDTPAFEVDRILGQVAEHHPRVRFLPYVGRAMTVTRRNGRSKRHVVDATLCETCFNDRLGVHLSKAGYGLMMDKLGDVFF